MVKTYSPELDLYLPNPVNEANDNFNLDVILNENWQKIDAFAQYQNQLNDDTVQSLNSIGVNIGNLSNLTTEEKTNLVLAMNDVLLQLTTHQAEKATKDQLGHVQIGNGLSVDTSGVVSTANYEVHRSGKDSEGLFTVIEYKAQDGTLVMKSTLSGGTSQKYTTRTEEWYASDGATVAETVTFSLSYDADGDLISEVF